MRQFGDKPYQMNRTELQAGASNKPVVYPLFAGLRMVWRDPYVDLPRPIGDWIDNTATQNAKPRVTQFAFVQRFRQAIKTVAGIPTKN